MRSLVSLDVLRGDFDALARVGGHEVPDLLQALAGKIRDGLIALPAVAVAIVEAGQQAYSPLEPTEEARFILIENFVQIRTRPPKCLFSPIDVVLELEHQPGVFVISDVISSAAVLFVWERMAEIDLLAGHHGASGEQSGRACP